MEHQRGHGLLTEEHLEESPFLSSTALRVEMLPDRVVEGDDVTLTCKTTCNLTNAPTFTWYHHGSDISSISSSNPLRLLSVRQNVTGDYRCSVQGQNYRSREVALHFLPEHTPGGAGQFVRNVVIIICIFIPRFSRIALVVYSRLSIK